MTYPDWPLFGLRLHCRGVDLAFDHLGAVAAVSSARFDNHASLGVSRRIGYADNGVGFVRDRDGRVLLQHLRLTAEAWRAAGLGASVTVTGFPPTRPWFGLDARAGSAD